ncbi:MAG: hypothetical protein H0T44_16395 [Gemmatimonadales bacterium]|nr:hypothetical protein [Gemmatimonadales bacterium]MDQ3427037.1 hypothetical protein [Gemmatimonadota bacterium]
MADFRAGRLADFLAVPRPLFLVAEPRAVFFVDLLAALPVVFLADLREDFLAAFRVGRLAAFLELFLELFLLFPLAAFAVRRLEADLAGFLVREEARDPERVGVSSS